MNGIEIMVFPSRKALTLLPTAMVQQVLPYAPVMAEKGEHHYVRGSLIVQYDKLPVIDLDYIYDSKHEDDRDQQTQTEEGAKLIWVKSMGTNAHVSGYVLIARGTPQILSCTAETLHTASMGDGGLVNRFLELEGVENPNHLPIILPDLFVLEAELASV